MARNKATKRLAKKTYLQKANEELRLFAKDKERRQAAGILRRLTA